MTSIPCTTPQMTWVGIDIAKKYNDVLVDRPGRRRRRFQVANQLEDYHRFANFLERIPERPVIGFEATGNYHRPLAFFLAEKGFALLLYASAAVALRAIPLRLSEGPGAPAFVGARRSAS